MILELMELILLVLGGITASIILLTMFNSLITKIRNIMVRQCKIKCLCKHEWMIDFKLYTGSHVDYTFKCEKCGKILKVNNIITEKKGVVNE